MSVSVLVAPAILEGMWIASSPAPKLASISSMSVSQPPAAIGMVISTCSAEPTRSTDQGISPLHIPRVSSDQSPLPENHRGTVSPLLPRGQTPHAPPGRYPEGWGRTRFPYRQLGAERCRPPTAATGMTTAPPLPEYQPVTSD